MTQEQETVKESPTMAVGVLETYLPANVNANFVATTMMTVLTATVVRALRASTTSKNRC